MQSASAGPRTSILCATSELRTIMTAPGDPAAAITPVVFKTAAGAYCHFIRCHVRVCQHQVATMYGLLWPECIWLHEFLRHPGSNQKPSSAHCMTCHHVQCIRLAFVVLHTQVIGSCSIPVPSLPCVLFSLRLVVCFV